MTSTLAARGRFAVRHGLGAVAARQRGPLVAVGVFVVFFVTLQLLSRGRLNYFEISTLATGSAALALAAMGETAVVLTGGFDLSVGAVLSLVNVVLATHMADTLESKLLWAAGGVVIGALVGIVNGACVAFLRLQSIVVTLATMFIAGGATLLVLKEPGGQIPADFAALLTGDALPKLLPAPFVLLAVVYGIWRLVRGARIGTAIYAVGNDEGAAFASGVDVRAVKFFSYAFAGALYGVAGVFISAQTGSGDPNVGQAMLLQVFTAVVLGGTVFGGGRGGLFGTIVGAYTLAVISSILLVLNVSAYYSTVVEGAIIVLAVLGSSANGNTQLRDALRRQLRRMRARSPNVREGAAIPGPRPRAIRLAATDSPIRVDPELHGSRLAQWASRNRDTLRLVLPSYVLLIVAIGVARLAFGTGGASLAQYGNSLLVLTAFAAILGLGQGAVILTGGLDLSIPWTIALCGALLCGWVNGLNDVTAWAVPAILLLGALVGFVNGCGIVFFGLPPIVMTLAMNGILQGAALLYDNGTPHGSSSPALSWFMTGHMLGVVPAVIFLIGFVAFANALLNRTAFGRWIYAVGNSMRAARLSGLPVDRTVVGVYILSGLCSALVGIMLVGFNGQAFNGMGDPYLLPSIAVVVVGGTAITGGRGHYLGILGGALLLTAVDIVLSGSTLPQAVRDIIYGCVILGAVLALREKKT
jgi:ribose transport system permease protein